MPKDSLDISNVWAKWVKPLQCASLDIETPKSHGAVKESSNNNQIQTACNNFFTSLPTSYQTSWANFSNLRAFVIAGPISASSSFSPSLASCRQTIKQHTIDLCRHKISSETTTEHGTKSCMQTVYVLSSWYKYIQTWYVYDYETTHNN